MKQLIVFLTLMFSAPWAMAVSYTLELSEQTLTRANIEGNAIGTYAPDSISENETEFEKSIIQGRILHVLFDEEMMREITASQNAMSIYRPAPEDNSGPPGNNEVRASRITIALDQGQLLQVQAEGSVTGTYKPDQ